MKMAISSPFLAFVAGILSILSPCVLPVLPIVLGTAASSHRRGPLALAAGLSLSFVAIGLSWRQPAIRSGWKRTGFARSRQGWLSWWASCCYFRPCKPAWPPPPAQSEIGPTASSQPEERMASLDNSGSAYSSVPYGAPASDLLSEPRRFSRHRERTSPRLRLQCSRSASGRRFRFWGWGGCRGKLWCDGAAQCCRPAAA